MFDGGLKRISVCGGASWVSSVDGAGFHCTQARRASYNRSLSDVCRFTCNHLAFGPKVHYVSHEPSFDPLTHPGQRTIGNWYWENKSGGKVLCALLRGRSWSTSPLYIWFLTLIVRSCIYFSRRSLLLDTVAFPAPAIWSWELDASSHQKSIVRVFIVVLSRAESGFLLKQISEDDLSVLIWKDLNTKWRCSGLLTYSVSKNVRLFFCCCFF